MDSSSIPPLEHARLISRKIIRLRCGDLVRLVNDTFARGKRAQVASRTLTRLKRRSPGYAAATYPRIVSYIGAYAALLFAYVIDLILVGVVAEYFATQLFPETPVMAMFARYLAPLALLGIENAIAMHLAEAQRRAPIEGRGTVRAWRMFGVFWALVVPIIVLGAQLVIGAGWDGPPSPGFRVLTYGLVALAFALHLFVLFGAELNELAQGYLLYQAHRTILLVRRWWLRRGWMSHVASVRVQCVVVCAALKDHISDFGDDLRLELPKTLQRTLVTDMQGNDTSLVTAVPRERHTTEGDEGPV